MQLCYLSAYSYQLCISLVRNIYGRFNSSKTMFLMVGLVDFSSLILDPVLITMYVGVKPYLFFAYPVYYLKYLNK
jgi:hypothetical protein